MRLTPQPRCLSASIAATSSGVRILSLRASPCAEACPTPLSPASSIANPLPCSRGRFHVAREGVSMSADNPQSTAAVVFGAHDWTEAGLGRAPSFLRSAKGILGYLYDSAGLGLDPDLVLDFFDSGAGAGEQLAEIRDALDIRL